MSRRHEHDMQPVDVYAVSPNPLAPLSGGLPRTVVLLRCSCGMLDTVVLPGKWTIEQVLGHRSVPSAADVVLKAAGLSR